MKALHVGKGTLQTFAFFSLVKITVVGPLVDGKVCVCLKHLSSCFLTERKTLGRDFTTFFSF